MVADTASPLEKNEEAEKTEDQPAADQSKSGVKKWTAIVLLICLVLLVLHVLFGLGGVVVDLQSEAVNDFDEVMCGEEVGRHRLVVFR